MSHTRSTTSYTGWSTEAAASVNAAASSVPDAQKNTYGCAYDNVWVSTDNAYTLNVYGHTADFSATTSAVLLYTSSGNAATTGGGKAFVVPVAGWDWVSAVVTNDGADASTITVKHRFYNA